jgi:hypothetical protein
MLKPSMHRAAAWPVAVRPVAAMALARLHASASLLSWNVSWTAAAIAAAADRT